MTWRSAVWSEPCHACWEPEADAYYFSKKTGASAGMSFWFDGEKYKPGSSSQDRRRMNFTERPSSVRVLVIAPAGA